MLLGLIGLFAWWLDGQPDQLSLGPRKVALRFEPLHFDQAGFAPFAWPGVKSGPWSSRAIGSVQRPTG